jgi:uncharacterized protein (DUF427 family)
MDTWFQEDEPCYIHPKDPTKRIETLSSTCHVRIAFVGHTLASSNNVIMLIEPLLPTRYYLPKTSVDWDVMVPSDTTSGCPYKGEANYYSVVVQGVEMKDLAWWYKYPAVEVGAIAGRVCFYNEKVEVFINGGLQKKPVSKFS